MIGKEDPNQEEEAELKVTDRRKFNVDGSLRDGVTIEKEKPKDSPPLESSEIITDVSDAAQTQIDETAPTSESPLISDEVAEEAADAKDPASFINFLSTLVTNAAAALGAIPHPVSGQKTLDLETGKYWIDVLTMLRKKTAGNLSGREETLFDSVLSDLKMQFVAVNRATEEKLKAQAAQKFSSKDILGG